MGWEDRDWAKWDDRERAHFLGAAAAPARAPRRVAVSEHRVELTLLAMLASASLSFAVAHFHLYQRLASPHPKPASAVPVVYGSAVTDAAGRTFVCTAVVRRPGQDGTCTAAATLQPGQRAMTAGALPPGCRSLVVDQRLGRWVCAGD